MKFAIRIICCSLTSSGKTSPSSTKANPTRPLQWSFKRAPTLTHAILSWPIPQHLQWTCIDWFNCFTPKKVANFIQKKSLPPLLLHHPRSTCDRFFFWVWVEQFHLWTGWLSGLILQHPFEFRGLRRFFFPKIPGWRRISPGVFFAKIRGNNFKEQKHSHKKKSWLGEHFSFEKAYFQGLCQF